MRKRVNVELQTVPAWLVLAEGETLLFCGTTPAKVKNPLAGNAKHQECVVLTDKRLVTLCRVAGVQSTGPAVTTIPISKVQSIQTTALSWNPLIVLLIIIGLCLWVIPGLTGLIYMLTHAGPRVNVVAGVLRTEVKFAPSSPALMGKFIAWLDLYSTYR